MLGRFGMPVFLGIHICLTCDSRTNIFSSILILLIGTNCTSTFNDVLKKLWKIIFLLKYYLLALIRGRNTCSYQNYILVFF
jgi:hypothetical protein